MCDGRTLRLDFVVVYVCVLSSMFRMYVPFTMLTTLDSYYSQWEHYICAWPTFMYMQKHILAIVKSYKFVVFFRTSFSSFLQVCVGNIRYCCCCSLFCVVQLHVYAFDKQFMRIFFSQFSIVRGMEKLL